MKKAERDSIDISRAYFDKRGGDGRTPWTISVRLRAASTRVWVLRFAQQPRADEAVTMLRKAHVRRGNTITAFFAEVEGIQEGLRLQSAARSRAAYSGITAPDGAIGDGGTREAA